MSVFTPRVRMDAQRVLDGASALAQLRAGAGEEESDLRALVAELNESKSEVSVTLAARILDVDKSAVRAWKKRKVLEGAGKGVNLGSLAEALAAANFIRGAVEANPALWDQMADYREWADLAPRIEELRKGETFELDLDHLDELFN